MFNELSNAEIIQILGQRFRQYRLILKLTQQELAQKAGISVLTIQRFESGTATNITMATVFSLLRHTGLINNADDLIPEQPENPYAKKRITKVRHAPKKNNNNPKPNQGTLPE